MIKAKKGTIIKSVLVLAGIVIFIFAVRAATDLAGVRFVRYMSLYEGYGVDEAEKFINVFLEENTPIIFWSEEENVCCENPDIGRIMYIEQIKYSGSPGVLYPSCENIWSKNKRNCIIDEKVAMELYGSLDVTGHTITLNGEEYMISFIMEGQQGMILSPALKNDSLNMMTIQSVKNEDYEEAMQKLISNYGIEGNVIELKILYKASLLLVLLLPMVGTVYLIQMIQRLIKNGQMERRQKVFCALLITITGMFVVYLGSQLLTFSSGYGVNNISNFEAWSEEILRFKEDMIYLFRDQKQGPILKYWFDFYKIIICVLLSSGCFMIAATDTVKTGKESIEN